jgi:hypothetical protein
VKLTLEDDSSACGKHGPCPKIWTSPDDPDGVFIQGRAATELVSAEAVVADDEVVARYPRKLLLDWAARQLEEQAR